MVKGADLAGGGGPGRSWPQPQAPSAVAAAATGAQSPNPPRQAASDQLFSRSQTVSSSTSGSSVGPAAASMPPCVGQPISTGFSGAG